MSKQTLLTAAQIAEILGMSVPYCYKVIAKLNSQLEKEGYMTIRGKISKAYFEEKYYGLKSEEVA